MAGGFTILIVLYMTLGNVVLTVWAVVDASSRSRVAFYVAGYNRTAWIVVLVTAFFFALGAIPATVYLLGARPRVTAAALRGF